jgi:hypothetical protein
MSGPAAHQVRRFSRGVQEPATSPSSRHEVPRVSLYSLNHPYRGLPELDYRFHDKTIQVTCCGRICLHLKKINLSTVFASKASKKSKKYLAGQLYELRSWLRRCGGNNPATSRQPVWPKSVTVRSVTYVSGPDTFKIWSGRWESNPTPFHRNLLKIRASVTFSASNCVQFQRV